MIAPATTSAIAIAIIILSKIFSIRLRSNTVFVAFIPIFFFLALRYNYGNDYKPYLEMFEDISWLQEIDYADEHWHAEIGWLFLNNLFSKVGFFPMVAFLAAINCYICAKFIKEFVPLNYYWLAIFIYALIPENMLILSSAMRQNLAIILFLASIKYISSKSPVKYITLNFIGSLFHTSALFLLPVYFLILKNIQINKSKVLLVIASYVILFLISDSILVQVFSILQKSQISVFDRYIDVYEEKGAFGYGLGAIYYGLNLIMLLVTHDRQTTKGKIITQLAIVGILLMPMSGSIMMISRIAIYFKITMLAAIPLVASQIKLTWMRNLFVSSHILFSLTLFYQFFQSPIWQDAFGRYQTIFDAL